jgi:hypothetical protein
MKGVLAELFVNVVAKVRLDKRICNSSTTCYVILIPKFAFTPNPVIPNTGDSFTARQLVGLVY